LAADDKRLVPHFQLLVDGSAADPELAASVIGIRVTDDMDRASRFWLHLSDVGRKWTQKNKFKPGTQIEIKLGYQGKLKSVCKGEVSNLEIVLTPDGPSRLVASGLDKGHNFDKGTLTKTYKDVKDSDLARRVAQRHGLSADVEDSKVVHDFVIQNNLSDYDFLMQRAAVAGFRVYVDDKKLLFKRPKIGDPPAARLVWRENIGRFIQEVNTFDQVSKITTTGWDVEKKKEIPSAAKSGAEYGKQGGTETGEQLVKKMFGEIEAVYPLTTGQKNILEAVAKSEYNKRAGVFVHAEARVTGDPAIRAGSVVEVEKAGKRVDGQYYVVSTDHIFFVDTGYATEFRARRYTIKKGQSPVKNLAKSAQSLQQAAQQMTEIAAFRLKAAREAANSAHQAIVSARQVLDQVKEALAQVKQGNAELAQTALKQAEGRLKGLGDYVAKAKSKVGEAGQETAAAKSEMARDALSKAQQAAAGVSEIAERGIQHASDAHDAVKAAVLDALHTTGAEDAPLSGAVQGIKSGLLAAADIALNIGKAGLAVAQAAVKSGQTAVEMCAAQATAAAGPLVEALPGLLEQVVTSVQGSSDAAGQSIFGAIGAGAQHGIDQAKKAIGEAHDGIAKAKDAVDHAQETIKQQIKDTLGVDVDQTVALIKQTRDTVKNYEQRFHDYKKLIEDKIDEYGGKWIKAGLYIKEHGENAFKAGSAVYQGIGKGLELLKEKKWDEAEKDVEPAQKNFETARSEVQLCVDKLKEVESDLPDGVRSTLQAIIDNIAAMLPQGESSVGKFIEAVKAKVGKLAAEAKAIYQKGKKILEQVKAEYEKYKKQLEELKEFYQSAKETLSLGEKVWGEGKEAVAKCGEALQKAEKRDWEAAEKDGEEAQAKFESAQKDFEACSEKAQETYAKLPERVKAALEHLLEQLKASMGHGQSTLGKTSSVLKQRLGHLAQQAKEFAGEVAGKAKEYKAKYDQYRADFEQIGKVLEEARAAKEAGDLACKKAGGCFKRVQEGLKKIEAHDLEGARKDGEDAEKLFGEAQEAAGDFQKKADRALSDVPEDVRKVIRVIADKVQALIPQGGGKNSALDKFTKLLDQAEEQGQSMLAEAKQAADDFAQQAQSGLDEVDRELEEKSGAAKAAIDGLVGSTKTKVEAALKALEGLVEKGTAIAEAALKRDPGACEKSVEEATAIVKQCQEAWAGAAGNLEQLKEKAPQSAEKLGQPLVDQAKGALDSANELLARANDALAEAKKDGLAEAKSAQSQAAQIFAKLWDEARKDLEAIAEEMKKKISATIDRLLKKIEDEVLKGAEKVLEKSLETATQSWDLKETESASEAEAAKQLKQIMQDALAAAKEELEKLWEDFKGEATRVGGEMLTNLAMGTDAAGESADSSVAASREVQNNPVRKADEHAQGAKKEHGRLSQEHDQGKDKNEEQTKQFLKQLKDQYKELHAAGEKMQGPLGETLKKSDTAIGKSAEVFLSQARGAVDQVQAAHAQAKAAYEGAEKKRADLSGLVRRIPAVGEQIESAFQQLQSSCEEGDKAVEKTRETVRKYEKQVEIEAEKITAPAEAARKRAEEKLAWARQQMERNAALFAALPSRPGTVENARAADSATQSATGAATSATTGSAQAKSTATGACKVPDDEKVRSSALGAIGELEKAAKKAAETADKAQSAVDSARSGDAAGARKNAGAAQNSAAATAAASSSASSSAQRSQQSAQSAAGKKEPPKEEAKKAPAQGAPGGASSAAAGAAAGAASGAAAGDAAAGAQAASGGAAEQTKGEAGAGGGAGAAGVADQAQGAAGGAAEIADQAKGAAGIADEARSAAETPAVPSPAGLAEKRSDLVSKASELGDSAKETKEKADDAGKKDTDGNVSS
jgi:phage protein D/DNA repair exonuclease SbcCD ATPase subunit